MIDSITGLLEGCACLSEWTRWLCSDQGAAAIKVRRFLDHALGCVAPRENAQFKTDIFTRREGQVDDLLMELIAHQIFYQFELKPSMYPRVLRGLTPDLSIDIGGQRYLADVFVTNSPSNTLSRDTSGLHKAVDRGERARKIAQRIGAKAVKYADCGDPLIVVVFLGDHRILDTWNVEEALYGVAVCEFDPTDRYPADFHFERRMGGCILPTEDEPVPHRTLSAVIVCDWFDTLNRDEPGKRVRCTVLHHYDPQTAFPAAALAPFHEVSWEATGDRSWRPRHGGGANMVGRLGSDGRFEFGTYSAGTPW